MRAKRYAEAKVCRAPKAATRSFDTEDEKSMYMKRGWTRSEKWTRWIILQQNYTQIKTAELERLDY